MQAAHKCAYNWSASHAWDYLLHINGAVTFPICPFVRNEHTRGSRGAPLGPVIKLRGPVWASLVLLGKHKEHVVDAPRFIEAEIVPFNICFAL